MAKQYSATVNAKVEQSLKAKLAKEAKDLDVPLSTRIRAILEKHVEENDLEVRQEKLLARQEKQIENFTFLATELHRSLCNTMCWFMEQDSSVGRGEIEEVRKQFKKHRDKIVSKITEGASE